MANEMMVSGGPLVHVRDGVTLTNSRHVATTFGKQHAHVLRDIDAIKIHPDLDRSWFRETEHEDSYGRVQRSVDMTRDGFTILVMRYKEALQFQLRYIAAFNEMERSLRETANVATAIDVQLLKMAVAQERAWVAIQAVNVGQGNIQNELSDIKTGMRDVNGRLLSLEANVQKRRKIIRASVRQDLVETVIQLGRRCPCCGEAEIITCDGMLSPFAELDHFYENSKADIEHVWPICKKCHNDMTYNRVARPDRESDFKAFHAKRRRLPGRQPRLFG